MGTGAAATFPNSDMHGALVPREEAEKSLSVPVLSHPDKKGGGLDQPYGIRGCVMVLEPSLETLRQVQEDVNGEQQAPHQYPCVTLVIRSKARRTAGCVGESKDVRASQRLAGCVSAPKA